MCFNLSTLHSVSHDGFLWQKKKLLNVDPSSHSLPRLLIFKENSTINIRSPGVVERPSRRQVPCGRQQAMDQRAELGWMGFSTPAWTGYNSGMALEEGSKIQCYRHLG